MTSRNFTSLLLPSTSHQNESLDWQPEPEQPSARPPNSSDLPLFLYIWLQSCAAAMCARVISSNMKVPRPIQPVPAMVYAVGGDILGVVCRALWL